MSDPGQDAAISEVERQLRTLLQPPLFFGATPSTPFRIATLVNNELAEHSHAYLYCEDRATPLLEKWFSEHPTDVFTAAARESISNEATMQRLSSMPVADRAAVVDALSYFGLLSPTDRMELIGQLHADSASAAPLSPIPENKMDDGSSVGSLNNAVQGMGVQSEPEPPVVAAAAAPASSLENLRQRVSSMKKPGGPSPAAGVMVSYGQAKGFIAPRVKYELQRSTISPLERELASLRAQNRLLEGNHDPSSDAFKTVFIKAKTQFAMQKSIGNMETRAKQLKVHSGRLDGLIVEMQKIRRLLSDERLIVALLQEQVAADTQSRGGIQSEALASAERKREDYLQKQKERNEKELRERMKRDAIERELRFEQLEQFAQAAGMVDDEAEEDQGAEEDYPWDQHEQVERDSYRRQGYPAAVDPDFDMFS